MKRQIKLIKKIKQIIKLIYIDNIKEYDNKTKTNQQKNNKEVYPFY